jgi:hypothetical protein
MFKNKFCFVFYLSAKQFFVKNKTSKTIIDTTRKKILSQKLFFLQRILINWNGVIKNYFISYRNCEFMFSFSVFSQTVTYTPPNNYKLFEPVYELRPTLTGGIYRQFTLFTGTGASEDSDTFDRLTSNFGIVLTKK